MDDLEAARCQKPDRNKPDDPERQILVPPPLQVKADKQKSPQRFDGDKTKKKFKPEEVVVKESSGKILWRSSEVEKPSISSIERLKSERIRAVLNHLWSEILHERDEGWAMTSKEAIINCLKSLLKIMKDM